MSPATARTRIALKNILFATDFSRQSKAALPYALSIARKFGAKIYAVHVVPFPPPAPRGSLGAVKEQLEREAQEAMAHLVPRFNGVEYETLLENGDVWEALSGIITRKEIDLVVIGTHGYTGIERLLLGSVAEKIFRRATCPVLTVGPNVTATPEGVAETHEILYATDFTSQSLAAAPYAVSFAQENQAHLSLVYVIKTGEEKVQPDTLTLRLHGLVPAEAELWCKPKSFVLYGVPDVEILELARERAADLIVLGVRTPRHFVGATTHLGGATAHKIVVRAQCPVLTIRG